MRGKKAEWITGLAAAAVAWCGCGGQSKSSSTSSGGGAFVAVSTAALTGAWNYTINATEVDCTSETDYSTATFQVSGSSVVTGSGFGDGGGNSPSSVSGALNADGASLSLTVQGPVPTNSYCPPGGVSLDMTCQFTSQTQMSCAGSGTACSACAKGGGPIAFVAFGSKQ